MIKNDEMYEEIKLGSLSNSSNVLATTNTSNTAGTSKTSNDDDMPPIHTDMKRSIYKPIQKSNNILKTNDNNNNNNDNDNNNGSGNNITILHIFRFSKLLDYFIMTFAIFFSTLNGLVTPLMTFLLGDVFNVFTQYQLGAISKQTFQSQVESLALKFVGLGIGAFVVTMASTFLWTWTAERQSKHMKQVYFHSLLKMEMEYFEKDEISSGGLLAALNKDTENVHVAISTNIGNVFSYLIASITCLGLAFFKNAILTLVILASIPLVFIIFVATSYSASPLIKKERNAFILAGSIIENALANIKTVRAFNGQEKEEHRHLNHINEANTISSKLALIYALRSGFIQFLLLSLFVQGFWFGSVLIAQKKISPGDVLTVFYSTLLGANMLRGLLPHLATISKAKNSIGSIKKLMQRMTFKGLRDFRGFTLPSIRGDIEFHRVNFSYPSRPETTVLKNVDLFIRSGKTTVLVGQSGSGKSSIVQLIQKLYDPDEGTIFLDGRDLKIVKTSWLRGKIGVVSQEPELFDDTIFKNIAYGRFDHWNVTLDEVMNSCKLACIHDEIMRLPNGYDTVVGDRASKLSGGQKQRLAIARALIKDPAILILDEAFSALDTTSDMLIQKALENSGDGRTTIVITHQLKHIKKTDFVYVLDQGQVVEKGSVSELLEIKNGYYDSLFNENLNSKPKRKTKELEEINMKLKRAATISTTSSMMMMKKKMNIDENVNNINNDKRKSLLKRSLSVATQPGWKSGGGSFHDRSFESNGIDLLQGTATAAISKRYNDRSTYFGILSYYDHPEDYYNDDDNNNNNNYYYYYNDDMIDILVSSAIKDESIDDDKSKTNLFKLVKSMMNSKLSYGVGIFASVVNGFVMPVFSFVLANLLATYSLPDNNQLLTQSRDLSLVVLSIAFINGVSAYYKYWLLERASERLSVDLRHLGFGIMLKQPQLWFDKPENQPGKLVTILTNDTEATKILIGHFAGNVIYGIVSLIGGMIWAFIVGWQLALVGFGLLPILLFLSELQVYILQKFDNKQKVKYEDAANIFYQAISSIRTVFSLSVEPVMDAKFQNALEKPYKIGIQKAIIIGLTAGFLEGLSYFTKAVTFWYGSRLVSDGTLNLNMMLVVWTLVIFCTSSALQVLSTIPYYSKSKQAANSLLKIVNLSKKRSDEKSGNTVLKSSRGTVVFKNVSFSYPEQQQYPTTNNKKILDEINLTLQPGQALALVGRSGSGKSTVAALMQRLYEPDSGQILLDYVNIKDLRVDWLRDIIGVVSQEPVLFDMSIAENIAYGKDDATREEIELVAKQVNIHDYIIQLPNGYLTKIGAGGSQLSGGQKQRIAIARALIKKPKILILDEATSALDANNESFIQQVVLSQVQKGCTTLMITHQLNIIKNLDKIAYIENGKIVESGNHKELMSLKGGYYDLVRNGNS